MNISEILKILTKDHDITKFSDSDFVNTDSGWYGLARKTWPYPNALLEYVFSDKCAAAQADRNEYDNICDFDNLEHNMAGLAALLFSFRVAGHSSSYPFFAAIQEKLRSAETEFEKQMIIQESFDTEDWTNIHLKSPNNAFTIQTKVPFETGTKYHEFFCSLEGKKICLAIASRDQYEKLIETIFQVSQCFPFIEQCIPDESPEMILGAIMIFIDSRVVLRSISACEN